MKLSTFVLVLLFALANAALALLALGSPTSASHSISPLRKPMPQILATPQPEPEPISIVGTVQNADGPVEGARVRIQATENMTTTNGEGEFELIGLTAQERITITASATGHYIGWSAITPGRGNTATQSVTITLNPHFQTDNYEYDWFEENGVEGSAACGACHTSYPEWKADGHSQSAVNPRFLTMYAGVDVDGNKSPPVEKDNLGVPLPPDLSKPYFGPGFKLDFPTISGNCATCHTPMAAKIPNVQNCGWSGCHQDSTASFAGQILDPGVSPLDLKGDAAEGISCEFCHKIGQSYLNKKTGLPYPDLPGILSYKLYRPGEGHDLIFGPVDDIARTDVPEPRDVYLPLQEESAFCAGCHYGILGGVVVGNMDVKGGVLVYSSFSEWLESPYSDPENGQTCQDCHMRAGDTDFFAYPSQGGVIRDPEQVHNHRMLSEELLQDAVTLSATAQITGSQLLVDVAVTNDATGHHVPTDSPLRHAILVVEARDAEGNLLALESGPILPEWAGDLVGEPGRAYAKILQDEWTGEMPTGAIWRPVRIAEDTRLAALATDHSHYAFQVPTSEGALGAEEATADGQLATVHVRLLYRRAFQQLMEWKGWDDADILMEETTLQVKERKNAE
ncbi:MAG: hypothetical protein HC802_09610 [Caldilineaceae bacterium]|nr:hypothetical protein [Caldilineaceae bacterium]